MPLPGRPLPGARVLSYLCLTKEPYCHSGAWKNQYFYQKTDAKFMTHFSPGLFPWGHERRFNAWTEYCRQTYGGRLQKVSVNAGFSCPNRDGSIGHGGCSFCNNAGFHPSYCDAASSIHEQLDTGLSFLQKRYPRSRHFLAYFQAYTNTHAPLQQLQRLYEEALSHPMIDGLVIGTRPDCVDEARLDYLARLSEKCLLFLELGVESCLDKSLKRVNRGHDFAASVRAIGMAAERGIHTGIHLILGLPGESREESLLQVEQINQLRIQSIKLHQLQIVRDTAMAAEYLKHPEGFQLFSLDEYVDFLSGFLEYLRPDIKIVRLSGEVSPDWNIVSSWGKIRSDQVVRKLEDKLRAKDSFQGRLYGKKPLFLPEFKTDL